MRSGRISCYFSCRISICDSIGPERHQWPGHDPQQFERATVSNGRHEPDRRQSARRPRWPRAHDEFGRGQRSRAFDLGARPDRIRRTIGLSPPCEAVFCKVERLCRTHTSAPGRSAGALCRDMQMLGQFPAAAKLFVCRRGAQNRRRVPGDERRGAACRGEEFATRLLQAAVAA